MLTLQEMYDMAIMRTTRMAEAMGLACIAKAMEDGVNLTIRPRPRPVACGCGSREIYESDVDWERLMRENSDTRWNHC